MSRARPNTNNLNDHSSRNPARNYRRRGQTRALALDSGSAFPTYAEMHKALDDLHIVCECATMPEVETWYRGDAFAKEARQRAIDVLCRHTYAEREREMLIGFREGRVDISTERKSGGSPSRTTLTR